jgi:hypothetical protein
VTRLTPRRAKADHQRIRNRMRGIGRSDHGDVNDNRLPAAKAVGLPGLMIPISGLCAEKSSSGPFWRASLRGQKSRSKLEEGSRGGPSGRLFFIRSGSLAGRAKRLRAAGLCGKGQNTEHGRDYGD